MSFLQAFEQELNDKLDGTDHTEDIIRWASEKMLESYKNGIKAGRGGESVKRSGQSRRQSDYAPRRAPSSSVPPYQR